MSNIFWTKIYCINKIKGPLQILLCWRGLDPSFTRYLLVELCEIDAELYRGINTTKLSGGKISVANFIAPANEVSLDSFVPNSWFQ